MKTFKEFCVEINEAAVPATTSTAVQSPASSAIKKFAKKYAVPAINKIAPKVASVARSPIGSKAAVLVTGLTQTDTKREAPDADKPRDYGKGEGLQPVKKYVEPQRKISQPELGGMLRGEPQTLNLPKPEVRNIGPTATTTGGSSRPSTASKPAPKPIQKPAPNVVSKPVEKKSIPVTKPAAAPTSTSPSSAEMDDLRASAQRLRAATSDLTKKTGEWKSLQKPAPSSIHSQIRDIASSEPTAGRQAFPSSAKFPNQSVFSKVAGK